MMADTGEGVAVQMQRPSEESSHHPHPVSPCFDTGD